MKIINKTKNTVLASDVIIADTLLKRLKGLLGKKEFHKGQALIITPCNSIHTFFMHLTIDVLFIDKHNKVIKAIPSIKPFRLTRVYLKAKFVIELPVNTIKSALINEEDILVIE